MSHTRARAHAHNTHARTHARTQTHKHTRARTRAHTHARSRTHLRARARAGPRNRTVGCVGGRAEGGAVPILGAAAPGLRQTGPSWRPRSLRAGGHGAYVQSRRPVGAAFLARVPVSAPGAGPPRISRSSSRTSAPLGMAEGSARERLRLSAVRVIGRPRTRTPGPVPAAPDVPTADTMSTPATTLRPTASEVSYACDAVGRSHICARTRRV
jgi:hypothetical protein